ncbi:leucine-rich repeat-containing protein 57 [Bemisia tabaci]|uniref:leucine-rich repeat-containing protein 57 n=1 Tax=Bemisia tabaci TaxID=7038 RepID=UPI0008F9C8F1|nr:PREDICTED: leucine-rich repeat-containing protein 57-like [Bemisia tabaci]XP_018904551.1 PREDICTED: leucine-rich repeat-containing protein 57-like [Bemisia tabaci]
MGNSAVKKHVDTASKTGVLNLSKSRLNEFPSNLKAIQHTLRNIDLSQNQISSIPNYIENFSALKCLTLNNNKIDRIPDEIGNLKKLEVLSLESNRIKNIPTTISALENLKCVRLSENMLSYFPLIFCGMKHLDFLDLSKNMITEIPDGVSSLHVSELNLNQNQISILSNELSQCPRLKILRLEENCLSLSSITPSLLRDSQITNLSVQGNLFDMKAFMELEGYEAYMERFTAVKKKLY